MELEFAKRDKTYKHTAENDFAKENLMRYTIALLVLATAIPATAGNYDSPESLTSYLVSGGPPTEGIPALTNPNFVNPNQVSYLAEDDLVLGLVFDGEARAYPHNIGWWNEIVNDRIGDRSVTVSLCPLTGTGQVFNATDVDGSQIEFGVSGLLINSNLVMYDRRDGVTLYPQMIYTSINGDNPGQRLELLPVVETTWAMWKKMYPNTTVIAAGTGWERYLGDRPAYNEKAYETYPYFSSGLGDYRISNEYLIFPPSTSGLDTRFAIKDVVLGVCNDEQTKAYPFLDMSDGAVINDFVGDDLMVVVYDADSRTALAYFSELDGELLSFYAVEPTGELPIELVDIETGTRWNMLGEAVQGPLKGKRLRQVPTYNSMWFAWAAYWPETEVWQGEGIVDPAEIANTAVEETAILPSGFSLAQNSPNPFTPETQIRYQLPAGGQVQLSIYNSAGQLVRSLVDGFQSSGLYIARWDGRDAGGQAVASGNYIYRLQMPDKELNLTRIMSLVQ